MTGVIHTMIRREDPLSLGFRVFIQFPDTSYIYRYEVLFIDETASQVALMGIDFPEQSRVIQVDEYLRYVHLSDGFLQSKGRVLECVLHNILTIDGYEETMLV